MRRTAVAVLGALALVAGCGGGADDGEAAETGTPPSTASTSTSTSSTTTATTVATTTSTTTAAGCSDDAPIPAAATEVQAAPVSLDADGDGAEDALSTYDFEGESWVHVAWAAGGSAVVAVDDSRQGVRPLGGHDLDGDGADEAWVAIAGPASGSLVGVFRTVGCGLAPVVDSASGQPFVFPVTSSLGAVSGARCEATGTITLVLGQRADDLGLAYDTSETTYRYDGGTGQVTAGSVVRATVGFDEASVRAALACGEVTGALLGLP